MSELESLNKPITSIKGIGEKLSQKFQQLSLRTVLDLYFFIPKNYLKRIEVFSLKDLETPSVVTLNVKVIKHIPSFKRSPYKIIVEFDSIEIEILFFSKKLSYLKQTYPIYKEVKISGKIECSRTTYRMVHPDYVSNDKSYMPNIEPIYQSTYGLTSKVIHKLICREIKKIGIIPEWYPSWFIEKKGWPSFQESIKILHNPVDETELGKIELAKNRLIFDEFFAHQLKMKELKKNVKKGTGYSVLGDYKLVDNFKKTLPFLLTISQEKAVLEIIKDIKSPSRMNRLLQGDVGSGKTIVILLATIFIVSTGAQVTLMVPTEVLAIQHFKSFKVFLKSLSFEIILFTGGDKGKEREKKLKLIESGEAKIIIGTHSLFQKKVNFKNLKLAVIDEQHKFGVIQRQSLEKKGKLNTIIMSATPIPRSLALTVYGDKDLTLLNEKPKDRPSIETFIIPSSKIDRLLERIKRDLEFGFQTYWICPLIEQSEKIDLSNSIERFDFLSKALSNFKVGLIHGKMSPEEKEYELSKFNEGITKILVSTTVIEVGIDNPNAASIIIECANRFGLSQLHQLRGRVGRGQVKSSCFLIYDLPLSENAIERLKIMKDTIDGFKIAEKDLGLRGPGDFFGTLQSGDEIFRLASVKENICLLEEAVRLFHELEVKEQVFSKEFDKLRRFI